MCVAGIHVAVVGRLQEREERSINIEGNQFKIPLREMRIFLQDLPLRGPARPVHFIVDPRIDADLLCLRNGEFYFLKPRVGNVRNLEAETAVDEHARYALALILPELPFKLLFIEIAVPEPKGEDPQFSRWCLEVLPRQYFTGDGFL